MTTAKIDKTDNEDVNRFQLTLDNVQWRGFCEHGNEPSEPIKAGNSFYV
jgi:hypothetical protein